MQRPTITGILSLVILAASSAVAAALPKQVGQPAPSEARLYLPVVVHSLSLEEWPQPTFAPPPSATPTTEPSPTGLVFPSDTPTPTPTDTPTPTITLTPTATATETPTATPTIPTFCNELVSNGDFEQGPSLWRYYVSGGEEAVSKAIRIAGSEGIPAVPAHGGRWFAVHGGTYNPAGTINFELRTQRFGGVDTNKLLSATLSYWVALLSDEKPNGRPNDAIDVSFKVGDREYLVASASRSEEDLPTGAEWVFVQADATTILKRSGKTDLIIRTSHDNANFSWYFVDDVSVLACYPAR